MQNQYIVVAHRKEIAKLDGLKTGFGVFECGVGILESMHNFTDFLREKKPSRVVLAGTAGSFEERDIFQIRISSSFCLPEYINEEIPEFLASNWKTIPAIHTNEKETTVFSGFGISISSLHFRDQFKGWENMEAAGLSYLCYRRKIPFSAVLCCTNKIGPEGRIQWKQNYQKAGDLLFDNLGKLF